jgi:hypothetical protein
MRVPHWMLVLILLVAPSQARAESIINGSFEMGSPQPSGSGISLPSGSTTITGWTVIGGPQVLQDGLAWLSNGNPFLVSTPFGNNFLDLTGYRDTAPYFGITQTIPTVANQAYTLTFDLGVLQGSPIYSGPIGVTAMAGTASSAISNFNPSGTGNIWQQFSLNFTATGSTTPISFLGTQGNEYIGLDNVSVNPSSVVPEPSSIVLGSIGIVVLGCFIRRQRPRRAV